MSPENAVSTRKPIDSSATVPRAYDTIRIYSTTAESRVNATYVVLLLFSRGARTGFLLKEIRTGLGQTGTTCFGQRPYIVGVGPSARAPWTRVNENTGDPIARGNEPKLGLAEHFRGQLQLPDGHVPTKWPIAIAGCSSWCRLSSYNRNSLCKKRSIFEGPPISSLPRTFRSFAGRCRCRQIVR